MTNLTFDGNDPWAIITRDQEAIVFALRILQRGDRSYSKDFNPVLKFIKDNEENLITGWRFFAYTNAVSASYSNGAYPSADQEHWAIPNITIWDKSNEIEVKVLVHYHADECGYCGTKMNEGDYQCPFCGAA